MANYIKPVLSIIANSNVATADAGPFGFELSLSSVPGADASGRLTVDSVIQGTYTTSTTVTKILDGHDIMTAAGSDAWTVGSVGGYLYMKNMDTSGTDKILIGIVSGCNDNDGSATGTDSPTAPVASGTSALDATTNVTLRTMTLLPGEFAFFPWDYTGDIYVENTNGDPVLEYWLFDRG